MLHISQFQVFYWKKKCLNILDNWIRNQLSIKKMGQKWGSGSNNVPAQLSNYQSQISACHSPHFSENFLLEYKPDFSLFFEKRCAKEFLAKSAPLHGNWHKRTSWPNLHEKFEIICVRLRGSFPILLTLHTVNFRSVFGWANWKKTEPKCL